MEGFQQHLWIADAFISASALTFSDLYWLPKPSRVMAESFVRSLRIVLLVSFRTACLLCAGRTAVYKLLFFVKTMEL